MDAQNQLRVLRDKWTGCTKCALSKTRRTAHIAFGAGPFNADYVVVTDAPTDEEVRDGIVLGGESGQLVEDMLERAGISPREDVFRTSVVACRPYVVLPATEEESAREQDREPNKAEISACLPRLHEILYLVDPRIIIAMGSEPWKTLVSTKERGPHKSISTAAGELFVTWVPGRLRSVRYPVLATVSPKQLIANPSTAIHGPISTTIEAFMKAAAYLKTIKKEEST